MSALYLPVPLSTLSLHDDLSELFIKFCIDLSHDFVEGLSLKFCEMFAEVKCVDHFNLSILKHMNFHL